MRRVTNFALAAALCACAGCALLKRKPLPPLPVYDCQRALGPISVDGKLDEPSWAKAAPMRLVLREGTEKPPLYPTLAKALWDDQYLYVSFVCRDPDIWATLTRRDDSLWKEEVVEVFLDPKGDHNPYFEIEVNPANAVVDLRLMKDLKGLNTRGFMRSTTWNCKGIRTAVRIQGELHTWRADADPQGEWTVEMAIPFSGLDSLPHSPPRPGDVWRANFYRIERPAALGDEDDEYSCWSPIVISKTFHTVERFGYLRFVGANAAARP